MLLVAGCTSEYRPQTGVISTGNAGRVLVKLAASDRDPTKTGELRIVKQTDAIPEVQTKCVVRLDSSCADMLSNGTYRAEIWIASKLSGTTNWFKVEGASKDVEVSVSKPATYALAIQPGTQVDSVLLGSRGNAATLVDGKWQVTALVDSSDVLWVKVSNGATSTWIKYQLTSQGSSVAVAPVSPGAPAVGQPISLTLTPSNTTWLETSMVGNFSGTSSWQNINFGARVNEGLGGAYDGNTVGRLLVKVVLPDSLKRHTLVSAKFVYSPLGWGIRPTGGQNLTIEGHRMLRDWKEGSGSGQDGLAVSATNDGASAASRSNGQSWNKPMVGLDGIDAESVATTSATLPYLSLAKFDLDATKAVAAWIATPETNYGLVFRSIHEADGLYLDYPDFASDDNSDSSLRPQLVLEILP